MGVVEQREFAEIIPSAEQRGVIAAVFVHQEGCFRVPDWTMNSP